MLLHRILLILDAILPIDVPPTASGRHAFLLQIEEVHFERPVSQLVG